MVVQVLSDGPTPGPTPPPTPDKEVAKMQQEELLTRMAASFDRHMQQKVQQAMGQTLEMIMVPGLLNFS